MNDEILDKLKKFQFRISELRTNKEFFQSISVSLDIETGKNSRGSIKGPSRTVIKAALMDFRHFLMNDEPVNFSHICNQLYQVTNDPQLKKKIADAQSVWSVLTDTNKDASAHGGIRMVIDGEVLSSSQNLDHWLNGFFFHDGAEKGEKIKRLQSTSTGDMALFRMLTDVQRLSQLLFWFAEHVVQPILREHKISE